MLGTFSSVKQYLKFDITRVVIDNIVFKLHYRWTFVLLLVATLLITSRQYIGEHIQCISDNVVAPVINTFCFFTPTFTVVSERVLRVKLLTLLYIYRASELLKSEASQSMSLFFYCFTTIHEVILESFYLA